MLNGTILADTRSPESTFWGNVVHGFESGLSRIGSEILPNWVGKELEVQKQDQLKDPLFAGMFAPYRIDGPIETAETTGKQEGLFERVLFDVGAVEVTGGAILIMGAVFVGAIIIFKKVL
jgi:hypothetical protein